MARLPRQAALWDGFPCQAADTWALARRAMHPQSVPGAARSERWSSLKERQGAARHSYVPVRPGCRRGVIDSGHSAASGPSESAGPRAGRATCATTGLTGHVGGTGVAVGNELEAATDSEQARCSGARLEPRASWGRVIKTGRVQVL
jgi:hypothetical protein